MDLTCLVLFFGEDGVRLDYLIFYCFQCLINNGKCYPTLEGDPSLELLS